MPDIEYTILVARGATFEEASALLMSAASRRIGDGWLPQGGIAMALTAGGEYVAQAMTRDRNAK